ncbi:MAG: TusE/DsrC/DsvC family sulfur relay protein [Candidatus Hatepunaea meridiana]|nr:TusE/DsrC/DsvC family sulfur relay protein [Candidatus Hatepunaea meridiana]
MGVIIGTFRFKNRTYQVDDAGFLSDRKQWDEDFAVGMAAKTKIAGGLTQRHWDVVNYIRGTQINFGKCPLVYQTCRALGLYLWELKTLFPTGYLRGACRLAGCSYKDADLKSSNLKRILEAGVSQPRDKTYKIDISGFLVDPEDWDEQFSILKANEMRMLRALTDKHWKIIYFLRDSYAKYNTVPTVYETCEANNIDIEELEKLFPGGYHRGAVKFAGLRVK